MKKSFVKGSFLGVIAGLAAGFLLAPKSGQQTRDDLKAKAQDAGGQLGQLGEQLDGKMAEAKVAAKDLKGEAAIEAAKLFKRAEVLRKDVQLAASQTGYEGRAVGQSAMKSAKVLTEQANELLGELEHSLGRLNGSAKDKAQTVRSGKPDKKA